jgi:thiosulfate dehydrogenase [quinone] large subunit
LDKWIPDFGKETYKAYPVILLRLLVGFSMFFAGFEKLIYASWHVPLGSNWSAAGYLRFVAGGGAFHDWFVSLAGNPAVEPLVIWGEILIGLALIIGLLTRFASFMGIILNGLFWLTEYMKFDGGEVVTGVFGWGWEHGPITQNALYIAIYIILILTGAGLFYGLDKIVHATSIVKKYSWLKVILG